MKLKQTYRPVLHGNERYREFLKLFHLDIYYTSKDILDVYKSKDSSQTIY